MTVSVLSAVGWGSVQAAGAGAPVFCFRRSSTLAAVGRVRLPKPAASSFSGDAGRVRLAIEGLVGVLGRGILGLPLAQAAQGRLRIGKRGRAAWAGEPVPVFSRRTDFGRKRDAPAAFEFGEPLARLAHRGLQARDLAREGRARFADRSRGPLSITAMASAASAASSSLPPVSAATARSSRSAMRESVVSSRFPSASSCAIATASARLARSMPAAESADLLVEDQQRAAIGELLLGTEGGAAEQCHYCLEHWDLHCYREHRSRIES